MHQVLEVDEAVHRYGPTVALDGIDLTVAAGECVALLGPNGAGKTTLVSLVTGLLRPQGTTRVRVLGADPRGAAARRHLGVVQQSVGFPPSLKVSEILHGAAARAGVPATATTPVAAEVGITDLLSRRATRLSGGQSRRLQLAMALIGAPALLVLDEPTSGLDIEARRGFWETLGDRQERGAAVLLTTHAIEEAAVVADRVVVVRKGRVVADGPPEALRARLPDRTITAHTSVGEDEVISLPGVASAQRDGAYLRVATVDAESVVRRLLDADAGLAELRVEGVGLEEAVLELTDGRGREKETL